MQFQKFRFQAVFLLTFSERAKCEGAMGFQCAIQTLDFLMLPFLGCVIFVCPVSRTYIKMAGIPENNVAISWPSILKNICSVTDSMTSGKLIHMLTFRHNERPQCNLNCTGGPEQSPLCKCSNPQQLLRPSREQHQAAVLCSTC